MLIFQHAKMPQQLAKPVAQTVCHSLATRLVRVRLWVECSKRLHNLRIHGGYRAVMRMAVAKPKPDQ